MKPSHDDGHLGDQALRIVSDFASLDPTVSWWVPTVVAPSRDWLPVPGCHRGARYLVDAASFAPARKGFPAFATRAACLRWIMEHRDAIVHALPNATVGAAPLAEWMLGMDA